MGFSRRKVYSLKCLPELLQLNAIAKEQNETRTAKYRRIASNFSRDQLNCLSTKQPKDERAFRASTSIISCVRERTFYAIRGLDDEKHIKSPCKFTRPTRDVLSTRDICYD